MVSTDPWPFDQPRNCASFVTREVMDREEPILLVTDDSDDHGWQFIGSSDGTPEKAGSLHSTRPSRSIRLSSSLRIIPGWMLSATLSENLGFERPTQMRHQPSNHAMERTADRPASTF